ncbi:tetratricopeptide repeat protein [Variovorax ginsengisoli]|uniref:Tetratricopeptide repeat protein n=1 Tax=Variovorax ginsengisoli TaxID=363844 RepID=A0ABT8RWS0_9BURK|nr:tetratricopeptide repeat protein [Variovorax ginsengisoli]MDN8611916.1 tetratricopeptide repeat protein [Variovorax ginsengisoli]MDO1531086.1 tetratricopeptide repeat protein [Variovorax ginsengisoli]
MSRRERKENARPGALRAYVGAIALFAAAAAFAAEPDPARARELVEAAQTQPPSTVDGHLELGRAYYVLGQYAEAKIEFETVLRFDNLPQDLLSQVEIYNQAATQALDEKRSLTGFGYAETGIGRYQVNNTVGTNALGGGDRRDTFYNARAGGGMNYALPNDYAIDATLDYRFRYYDNSESRNDSDLRWRLAGSRSFGESNLAVGFRGRTSYRGDGDYRNDAGLFADYRYRVDPDNQLTLGAEYRRRRYPEGRLRDRSRTSADVSGGWVHSLLEGAGSLTLTAHGGQHFATSRPDGNSSFYGATAALDFTVNNKLGWGTFVWWERDAFNNDRIHFHPDALDNSVLLRRKDNLYEVGAYLVWEFVPTWTLRPELLWIRDQSNSIGFNYSSTEFWLNIRKGF